MKSLSSARRRLLSSSLLSIMLLIVGNLHAQTNQISVSAGDWERRQTVITMPRAHSGSQWLLHDAQGRTVPIQSDPRSGNLIFILDHLPKGGTTTFQLTATPSAGATAVQAVRSGDKIKVSAHGKPAFEYQAEPGEFPVANIRPIFKRGGYIHPVFSPSGLQVTDDFPSDHRHHHGIWFPWTRTEFEGRNPDFWNMGQGSGRVEFVRIEELWSGPVFGGFRARHRHVDLTSGEPKTALEEGWEVRLYAVTNRARPYWIFDLNSTQTCGTSNALTLLKYHYGGLGVRGHVNWKGATNAFFLTSEGETDRVRGNETRARWCHMGGFVNGTLTGIAVLDHPGNFAAPQPLRLNPSDPFFCYAPSQLGDFRIEPGKPYVSRYRFVVMDGPPDRVELDRLWNDYAHPPEVVLK